MSTARTTPRRTRPTRQRSADANRPCVITAQGREVVATISLAGITPRATWIVLPQAKGFAWTTAEGFDGERIELVDAPETLTVTGLAGGIVPNDVLIFVGGAIHLADGGAIPLDREFVTLTTSVDLAQSSLSVDSSSGGLVVVCGSIRNDGISATRIDVGVTVEGPADVVPGSLTVAGATYSGDGASLRIGPGELTAVRFAVALKREQPDATDVAISMTLKPASGPSHAVTLKHELVRRPQVVANQLRILGPTTISPLQQVSAQIVLRNDGGYPAQEVALAVRVGGVGRFALTGAASTSFAYDPAEGHTLHAVVEAIPPFSEWTGTLTFAIPVDQANGSTLDVSAEVEHQRLHARLDVVAAPRADAARSSVVLLDAAGAPVESLRCAEPFSALVTIANAGDGVARAPRFALEVANAVEVIEAVGATFNDGELLFAALAPLATAEATVRMRVREVASNLAIGGRVLLDDAPPQRVAAVPLSVDVAPRFLAFSWKIGRPEGDSLPLAVEAINRGDGAAPVCQLRLDLPDEIELIPTAVALNGHRIRREEDARRLAGEGLRLSDVAPGVAIALDVALRRATPGQAWKGSIAAILSYGEETLRSERVVLVPALETTTLGFGLDVDVVAGGDEGRAAITDESSERPQIEEVVQAIESVGFTPVPINGEALAPKVAASIEQPSPEIPLAVPAAEDAVAERPAVEIAPAAPIDPEFQEPTAKLDEETAPTRAAVLEVASTIASEAAVAAPASVKVEAVTAADPVAPAPADESLAAVHETTRAIEASDAVDAAASDESGSGRELISNERVASLIIRPVHNPEAPAPLDVLAATPQLDVAPHTGSADRPLVSVALGALLGNRTLQTLAQRLSLLQNCGHRALYRHALAARLFAPTFGSHEDTGAEDIVNAVRAWEDQTRFTVINKCVMAEVNGAMVDADFETPDQRDALRTACEMLSHVDIFQGVESGYTSGLTTADLPTLLHLVATGELGAVRVATAYALLMVVGPNVIGNALSSYRTLLLGTFAALQDEDTREHMGQDASDELEFALNMVTQAVADYAALVA